MRFLIRTGMSAALVVLIAWLSSSSTAKADAGSSQNYGEFVGPSGHAKSSESGSGTNSTGPGFQPGDPNDPNPVPRSYLTRVGLALKNTGVQKEWRLHRYWETGHRHDRTPMHKTLNTGGVDASSTLIYNKKRGVLGFDVKNIVTGAWEQIDKMAIARRRHGDEMSYAIDLANFGNGTTGGGGGGGGGGGQTFTNGLRIASELTSPWSVAYVFNLVPDRNGKFFERDPNGVDFIEDANGTDTVGGKKGWKVTYYSDVVRDNQGTYFIPDNNGDYIAPSGQKGFRYSPAPHYQVRFQRTGPATSATDTVDVDKGENADLAGPTITSATGLTSAKFGVDVVVGTQHAFTTSTVWNGNSVAQATVSQSQIGNYTGQ